MMQAILFLALTVGPVAALPKGITVNGRERFVQLGGPYNVSNSDQQDYLTVKLSKVAAVNHAPDGTLLPVRWNRLGLFALPPNRTKDLDIYNHSKACIFDFLTEGHYGLFSDPAIQEVVRRWGQEVRAELKIRSYGSVALYFANCDAPDTNVYFHAEVATPQDAFEGAVVFFLCVIVAAAIIIPLRMVVRKWIRDRIARAFAARRHAQHPPHPPYQQLYQYPYAQHYSPLPTSAPPGSVPHVAAAGGPAAGPAAAAAAANTHVAVGYPVINSPPPQQHLLAVPAEAAAEPDKLETDPLLMKQHKATAGDANV